MQETATITTTAPADTMFVHYKTISRSMRVNERASCLLLRGVRNMSPGSLQTCRPDH